MLRQEQFIQVWWIQTGLEILLVYWISNWIYINIVLIQSSYHQKNIIQYNHTSGMNYQRPHYYSTWLSPPTRVCHSVQ